MSLSQLKHINQVLDRLHELSMEEQEAIIDEINNLIDREVKKRNTYIDMRNEQPNDEALEMVQGLGG